MKKCEESFLIDYIKTPSMLQPITVSTVNCLADGVHNNLTDCLASLRHISAIRLLVPFA